MTIYRYALGTVLLTLTVPCARAEEPQLSKAEVARLAKPSVAFVVSQVGRFPRAGNTNQGTAFCVHSSGLFITNAHVVMGAIKLQLVLNSSQENEMSYEASVVRTVEADDLALLRIEATNPLPALKLGDGSGLEELADVIACGYPFGSALTFGTKEYPSATLTAGAISSLRKKGGKLNRIQLDVGLNPGTSGGPILDMSGKVIGVVVSGVRGTRLNFAIPVQRVAAMIARPEIVFTAPAIGLADRDKEIPVEARLVTILPDVAGTEVELEVRLGKSAKRRHPLKLDDGVYRADVVLLPKRTGRGRLNLEAAFADGSLTGTTVDREVKLGAATHKLSEIQTVWPAKGQAVLLSGTPLNGKVTGLEAVPVTLGGKNLTVDLSEAQHMTLRMPSDELVLILDAVARSGGKEIGRVSHGVLLDEANKVYLAELSPTETRPGPWPLTIGMTGDPGDNPIKVNGQAYPKGLGLHTNSPPATATYTLSRTASVFRTTVAFDDSNDGKLTGPTRFEVYGDGKLLWRSKAITSRYQTDHCLVDVAGVDKLELRAGNTGSNFGAHAVWLDPILVGPDPDAIRRAAGRN